MSTPQQWAQVTSGRVTSVVTAELPPGGGWWPVEHVIPDHDRTTHRPSGARYEPLADKVRAVHTIVALHPDTDDPPPDEPDTEPQPDPTPDWLHQRHADREQIRILADAVDTLIVDTLMGGA